MIKINDISKYRFYDVKEIILTILFLYSLVLFDYYKDGLSISISKLQAYFYRNFLIISILNF